MRAETKKRLLAVLESDLKKLKEKLDNPKHRAELQQVHEQMSQLNLKNTTGAAYHRAALRFDELQKKSDKLFKDAKKYSAAIPKMMNEQFELEEEITYLRKLLLINPDTINYFFQLDNGNRTDS